jgi:hypothetical protein
MYLGQAGSHIINRYVHARSSGFNRKSAGNKPPDDKVHIFTDLNDVFIQVIKTNYSLTPRMLKERMYKFDIFHTHNFRNKGIYIVFFKIQLAGIVFKNNFFILFVNKFFPGISGLECNSTG